MGDDLDPALRGTDRLFAMQAVLSERMRSLGESVDDRLKSVADSVDALSRAISADRAESNGRLKAIEMEQAEHRGALKMLKWAVPTGPVAIGVAAIVARHFGA